MLCVSAFLRKFKKVRRRKKSDEALHYFPHLVSHFQIIEFLSNRISLSESFAFCNIHLCIPSLYSISVFHLSILGFHDRQPVLEILT